MQRFWIAVIAVLGVRVTLVHAQAVDVQHYQPAANLEGLATVKGAGVERPFTSTLQLTTVYLSEPLILIDAEGNALDPLVRNRVDVFASYAMALHERVALAAVVPFVPYQDQPVSIEQGQLVAEPETVMALADPRLEARLTILTQAGAGIDVALIPGVSLPTGGTAGYVSSKTTVVTGELALGRRLGPILLAANVGYRYRPSGAKTMQRFDVELTDQILWRAGLGLDLRALGMARDSQLAVEGFGLTEPKAPFSVSRQSPMEALGSVRVRVLRDFVVSAGGGTGVGDGYGAPKALAMLGLGWAPRPEPEPVPTPVELPPEPAPVQPAVITPVDSDGDGLNDDDDGCPQDFGPGENRGCPWPDQDKDGVADKDDRCVKVAGPAPHGCPDTDGDGLADHVDSCPHIPGPEPTGCPTSDRDGDGVLDDVDQCPDVPGDAPKGCPKKVLVVKHDDRIEIRQQINFETNKATIIGRTSFEVLDQVAAVLKSNPNIKVVIEGHTDDRGPDPYNLELSQSRAAAVRGALAERGIDSARLESIGYGETKPIASNRSASGRAANRRSEFKIVQAGEPAPAAPKAAPPMRRQAPDPTFFHLRLKKAQTLRDIAKALWKSDTHAALLAEHNPEAGGPDGSVEAGGVVKFPRTIAYTVQKGDTLGDIAKKLLGSAKQYKLIAGASREVMPDPNKMEPGMTLTIPLVLPEIQRLEMK